MKTPVILVAAALTAAILLASLVIATGTHGADGLPLPTENPANRVLAPDAK